ncbi:Adaptive-response sensory-kinase SasA [Arenibacter antarcticus]|uniref:histidine kinase n=1 Tax=Arenibacter antarcticus TaxID=2040469 RepID=A0ABW5VCS1_9FLAO|nr:PAS domain-containing sensor histidine kinase [Arenibacter sp. H213]MCM4168554.1 PAS domain-containing sensor histidine kinase [Arenibacter sp. H213]
MNNPLVLSLDPFFELSMDLLCIAGYDGYFRRVNPAFRKLLGYSEEELFSKLISDFIYKGDQSITASYRENLKKAVPLINYENRFITKSGELIWLQWTSIPLPDKQLIYAIAKNITHKKKLEEERNNHIVQLEEINKDLKQLSYTTSHDLRAPVNNLLTLFSFLDLSKIKDPDVLETLGYMKMATEGLHQSMDKYVDLLSLNDTLKVEMEEVEFESTFKQVRHSIESLVGNSNVKIEMDFSALPKVLFKKNYLESIFLNLLTNSIKYARPEVLPLIQVTTSVTNGVKQLIFEDNGLGFDMEKIGDRIFGLNQKFHGNADSKGVGLYLVYNHVTNLGGTITVSSEINKGATFIITFM